MPCQAAKSSVLNGLWLGPVNIWFWFKNDRFEDPGYALAAEYDGVTLDDVILNTLVLEMGLMLLSLFIVLSIFYAAKAPKSIFVSIIFIVCATTLWNGLSYALNL